MQQQSDILTSPLIVVKLEERDTVKSFDCGDEDLNDFILHESPLYRKEKLAVDASLKGNGIGQRILNFIKCYFTADNKTGCRFITVDAYAAAIPFYLRNGFVPLNDEDIDEPTRLLYFDLNDLDED